MELTSEQVDLLRDVAGDSDIWDEDVRIGYSGRGMYGTRCFGVVTDLTNYSLFVVNLNERDPDLALAAMRSVTSDSMGFSTIYYFTDLSTDSYLAAND